MAKRTPISKKTRFEVFKRDGFTCQYCGGKPPEKTLHVDHIHPVSRGGDNHIDNLISSCSECNLGKHRTPLTSIPQSLKDKALEIKEKEAQIKAYNKMIRAKKSREEDEIFEILRTAGLQRQDLTVNSDHYKSVKMFLKRLPFWELMDSAEVVRHTKIYSESSCFKYFCGINWRKIKEAQNG